MPKRVIKKILEIFTRKEEIVSLESTFEVNDSRLELKIKIAQIILDIRKRIRKRFGLLVVLGWRREWDKKHAAVLDANQNIFKNLHLDLKKGSFKENLEAIKKTIDFDGAILISPEGIILRSGIYLENIHPKKAAKVIHPNAAEDLSTAFGFVKKVHTRHLIAITGSYVLKDTTFFVFSEEDRSVRIMERGKIVWSTIKSEVNKN